VYRLARLDPTFSNRVHFVFAREMLPRKSSFSALRMKIKSFAAAICDHIFSLSSPTIFNMSHSNLMIRRDLSRRNIERARECEHPHELSYGAIPSVIYQEENGTHGNFIPASYRSICAHPEWQKRLKKSYTAGKWIPRSWERNRCELDCATSSDALLMNIFCYPNVLHRSGLCALLGIQQGLLPEFGVRPRIPLLGSMTDRTEVDMQIGDVLFEAKLTESGFRSAPARLLSRYRDLHQVFDTGELPFRDETVQGYQLIRGALAAYACDCPFILLCDGRRTDMIEQWILVARAVRSFSFRCKLKLCTWQELAQTLPVSLRRFLEEKYGIIPTP
jgi:hypothetical protein